MGSTRLLNVKESDYLEGLTDGQSQATRCNDMDDVNWYQRVVFDNLSSTRPHYVAGYVDGFGS